MTSTVFIKPLTIVSDLADDVILVLGNLEPKVLIKTYLLCRAVDYCVLRLSPSPLSIRILYLLVNHDVHGSGSPCNFFVPFLNVHLFFRVQQLLKP